MGHLLALLCSRRLKIPPAGSIDWAEPAVWTERMLAALEDGVKGACFAEHGLFSLVAAHAAASQSSRR